MAVSSFGIKINLSKHTDKFTTDCLELPISKKINFIFGKNGTGKTTIADELSSQFSDGYSVHVFKDFDGVAVNERLDAVALGTENAEIQKQIDVLDSEIAIISKEVEMPEDGTENLFTKERSSKKSLDEQQKKIEDFFKTSAKEIKEESNPNISSTSYDKNGFKGEIANAKTLTDEEITANKDTIMTDKKRDIDPVTLPSIDLNAYLKSTNEILEASVKQPTTIPELNNNPQKQQFAKPVLMSMNTNRVKSVPFVVMRLAKRGGSHSAIILTAR